MKSILQIDKTYCYLCGSLATEEHHIIHGTANRKLSEKYGLKVYLCYECHRGNKGVHKDSAKNIYLKKKAQKEFELKNPMLEFIRVFGRSWL